MGTLSRYVMRRFVMAFASAFAAVLLLVALVDLVEQLRRSAGSDTRFDQVLELALLHAPSLMLEILPFLTLIAAIACFSRLSRSSELVVTRAAGVSVWRLIAPAVLAAAVIGALGFAVLNPLSSGFLQRFERLEARWIKDRASLLSVSENGLWLRQADEGRQTVIHARRANGDGTQLWEVSVFRFGDGDRLRGRVDAGRAVLEPGRWVLYDVREWNLEGAEPPLGAVAGAAQRPGGTGKSRRGGGGLTGMGDSGAIGPGSLPPDAQQASGARRDAAAGIWTDLDQMTLPTDLTRSQILESFASPATISFWNLPSFIHALEAAGVSATRHRMHWQAQLALPLLLSAMVLIGAAFSMRHVRFGGLGLMALGAVGAGLGYFFLANVTQAFGSSGAIPAPVAAWIPPVAMSLLAVGLLLHLEDG